MEIGYHLANASAEDVTWWRDALGAQIDSSTEAPLTELSGSELNRLARESSSEFVAFINASRRPTPESFASLNANRGDDVELLIVPFDTDETLVNAWRDYPARLASLVAPAEANALLVFRRVSLVSGSECFGDVSHPLWDAVIRLVRDVRAVSVNNTDLGITQKLLDFPGLAPSRPRASLVWLLKHLDAAQPHELVERVASEPDTMALKAGLYLLHDYLDESHRCSQSVEGDGRRVAGDYWHAIMHRREPDASNSKYWFRRVGQHSVFTDLRQATKAILLDSQFGQHKEWIERLGVPVGWDPHAFVDLCEEARCLRDASQSAVLEQIQGAEMQLLLAATYDDATG
jgi:hypothetical protein